MKRDLTKGLLFVCTAASNANLRKSAKSSAFYQKLHRMSINIFSYSLDKCINIHFTVFGMDIVLDVASTEDAR